MAEVYELTMSAPGKNSLSSAHMRELIGRIGEAEARPLLLSGSEGAFSAGLNLKEVASLDEPGMERFLLLLDDLIDALFVYPGPTVACVNGHAIAGGCVLVLCCDLRVAATTRRCGSVSTRSRSGSSSRPRSSRSPAIAFPRHALERVVLEGALHGPAPAL